MSITNRETQPKDMPPYPHDKKDTVLPPPEDRDDRDSKPPILPPPPVETPLTPDSPRFSRRALLLATGLPLAGLALGGAFWLGQRGDSDPADKTKQETGTSAPAKAGTGEVNGKTEVSIGGYELTADQKAIYQSGDQDAINAEDDKTYLLAVGEALQAVYGEYFGGPSADEALSSITSSPEVAQTIRTEIEEMAGTRAGNAETDGLSLCPIDPDPDTVGYACIGRPTSPFVEGSPILVKANISTMDDVDSMDKNNMWNLNFNDEITRKISTDGSRLDLVLSQQ
jgi:hypothetical protein